MGKAVLHACDAGDADDSTSPGSIICTAKHFIGYSAPLSGKDRTDAWVPKCIQVYCQILIFLLDT